MATQAQRIASLDNDTTFVQVEYNDVTNRVTAVSATVARGTLTIEITRIGGQTRSFTLKAGTTRSTNVPAGMDLGFDPESGDVSATRGNIALRATWSAA